MAATNRSYPDISFVETDTETIVNALIQSYEKFTGRTLYPADPARLFILWVADIIVQERVNIDFSAKQNVPRYAEGEYLDSLAELFKDTYRLEPERRKQPCAIRCPSNLTPRPSSRQGPAQHRTATLCLPRFKT